MKKEYVTPKKTLLEKHCVKIVQIERKNSVFGHFSRSEDNPKIMEYTSFNSTKINQA